MKILPAIDLKDGKCVRLFKGDFETAHRVAESPLETAAAFKAAGADIMHLVDLDGAKSGERKNATIVKSLCEKSNLRVELGGGLRKMADLEEMDALGVWRMIIGSAAVEDSDFVAEAVKKFGGERIAVGIDALGGKVRTHGWVEDSGEDAFEFAKKMSALGVGTVIFTDIERDGMLSGPPIAALERLVSALDCGVVASGGMSSLGDVAAVKKAGVAGVIIGKAFYTGDIDLAAAVKLAGED